MSRCNGKIIIIDTGENVSQRSQIAMSLWTNKGISHAYGGALSALSVEYTLEPIISSSSSNKWREQEVVMAIYADRTVILVDEERDILGDI